jgi:quercetin dioxygenase-like cupin family protein
MIAKQQDSAARTRATFPLVGVPGTERLGMVYFEVEPGNVLGVHTDSQDEIVVVLSGVAEGVVGNERGPVAAGGIVFIPAMAPHGFRNTGADTLRCVGIFAGSDVVSTFEHALQPMGVRAIEHQSLVAV